MLFLSSINPNLVNLLLLGVIIIFIGSILRYIRQPYIIAYIIAGILIGKHGFQMIPDEETIHLLGEFGLILLLFFIGMEVNLPNLIKNWKVPAVGTLLQILGSVLAVALIGILFDWSLGRVLIFGFIISLSSSAVVIKLLQDNKETQSKVGQDVISILIVQDILIVPMLILTNYLGGNIPSSQELILQIVGAALIVGGIIWVIRKQHFTLPFGESLKDDHELQVIFALIVCFGFATLTALFGLSSALGAFVGGMVVGAANSTEWFHDSLHSFRVIFVALFFLSIGMLIDIEFLMTNWQIIALILLAVYFSNHLINSLVLHYFGENWYNSLYGGALLAQIGELSFILASSAFYSNIFTNFEYQMTIIVISLTLLISPFWITMTKKILHMKGVRS